MGLIQKNGSVLARATKADRDSNGGYTGIAALRCWAARAWRPLKFTPYIKE
jgi:hypothetical protein